MKTPSGLEELYKEFITDLPQWLPDGVLEVDLELLHHNKILTKEKKEDIKYFFHIIEAPEKITLFNEEFIVWIVPQQSTLKPATLTLVAKIQEDMSQSRLELAFMNRGVYNTSQLVLQVLEHFLEETKENESLIQLFND